MKVDLEKVRALAKPSHNSCLGSGVTGRIPGRNAVLICPCVIRALRRRGIHGKNIEVQLAPEPPASCEIVPR